MGAMSGAGSGRLAVRSDPMENGVRSTATTLVSPSEPPISRRAIWRGKAVPPLCHCPPIWCRGELEANRTASRPPGAAWNGRVMARSGLDAGLLPDLELRVELLEGVDDSAVFE